MSNPVKDYPKVVLGLSIALFVLFVITTVSIDNTGNQQLHTTGMVFSVMSMLIALAMIGYSAYVGKQQGAFWFGRSFGRRFGRR